MSDSPPSIPDPGREEILSALFAQMVAQQTDLAMMLLGRKPHPQAGDVQDLESARLFIDQLEMLQVKTKGNLSREEELFLKQSLMALHMAYVEAASAPAKTPAQAPAAAPEANPPAEAGPEAKVDPGAAESESKKKFSRKY
jgi:uncharacterized protein DUF1844